ncbi:hypothetical protein CK203_051540 [Vitis vinifera]|uniref:Uncharacterized protein n=2 Tax=Vitis vinifera TaxID=29760 RepID=A0A438GXH9_VITVI|nr:hypothetical protein CK203_051540 [Vitis vinifera]
MHSLKKSKLSSLFSFSFPIEQEQGLSSSIAFQAYAFFLTMLGVLFQVKFQGNGASPFEKHDAIISSFVIVLSIYVGTIILGKKFEMKTIEPIRLLSGAMAPILLLLILVPIFGWLLLVLWMFFAATMGWDYLQQLYQKLFCEASDRPPNLPEEGSQELPV